MAQLTRRNFVQVAGMTAATAALAACGNTAAPADDAEPEAEGEAPAAESAGDIFAAPDASAYPIEPDGEGVEALYEIKESRGGQIIYTKVIPGEWSAE